MVNLADARAALATATGALGYVPDVIDPPCVVIEPGDPYLTYDGAASFAWEEFIATLDVYVFVPDDENAALAAALDTQLLATLEAIESAEWSIGVVGKPDSYATADWTAYGVKITARRRVSRT